MKRSVDESELSDNQCRKSAKSLDFFRNPETDLSSSIASCEGDERASLNVKDVLRSQLLQKKTSSCAEVTAKEDRLELLEMWHRDLKSAGFSVELTSLTAKHSPFEDVDSTTVPDCVLVLHPSHIHTFHAQTGPFQPVRLVIHVDGAWSLHCPIFEHTVINSGKLLALETSRVIELAQEMLHENHTLCPGILKDFSCLGYVPENIRVIGGPTSSAHSKSCKIWHIPSKNIPLKSGSDPRLKSVCTECREVARYIKKRVTAKKNVDEATRMKRQMPNSHFPWQFLSPGSKSKRIRNIRQQRSRAIKQALKFYKKTKVELPSNQSKELCQLIQAIESSEAGKRELGKMVQKGNQFEGKGGLKAGDCVSETWRKDREEFFKDQQSNGEIALNYILMLNFLGQHTEKTMKIFFPSNIFMPGNNFLTLSAKIH